MSTTALAALALAGVGLSLGACGSSDPAKDKVRVLAPGEEILMHNKRYDPVHAEVKVGQKVTWRGESVPHDVVATKGASFKSKVFNDDEKFSWMPTKPGTVLYKCTLHPGMKGALTVLNR